MAISPAPCAARSTTRWPSIGSPPSRGSLPRSSSRCTIPAMRSRKWSGARPTSASCRCWCWRRRDAARPALLLAALCGGRERMACRSRSTPAACSATRRRRVDFRPPWSRTTSPIRQAFGSQLASLVAEGVFAKYPRLKVVLAESGVSWLPSLMWRMGKDWRGLRSEVPWVDQVPAEIIREHVRLTLHPLDLPPSDQPGEAVRAHRLGPFDPVLHRLSALPVRRRRRGAAGRLQRPAAQSADRQSARDLSAPALIDIPPERTPEGDAA